MGYWNEVKEVVRKATDVALEGAHAAKEKSIEGAKFARTKTSLFMKHRKLQGVMADLGDRVHDLYKDKKDIYADPEVRRLNEDAAGLEEECRQLEEKDGN